MPNSIAYDIIRKSLSDTVFAKKFGADPEGTLTEEGVRGEDQPDLRQIIQWASIGCSLANENLEEVRKLQKEQFVKLQKQSDETLGVASEMKHGLNATLSQIQTAFTRTMIMYQISFYLGVILIIAAVASAFLLKETLISAVFGSLGVIDILTFFLAKPQEQLESSRASLAQMQAALYNWFMDSANQITYLGQHFDMETMRSVSESLIAHTEKTLEMLQKSKVS